MSQKRFCLTSLFAHSSKAKRFAESLENAVWTTQVHTGTMASRGFFLSESWDRNHGRLAPSPPPPVILAPALRERETSGSQGNAQATPVATDFWSNGVTKRSDERAEAEEREKKNRADSKLRLGASQKRRGGGAGAGWGGGVGRPFITCPVFPRALRRAWGQTIRHTKSATKIWVDGNLVYTLTGTFLEGTSFMRASIDVFA